MKPLLKGIIALFSVVFSVSGCMTAEQHRASVANTANDRVTVGTVQREIRVGMTSADVAQVLGAPNVVTTDEQRRESWVYDKIATETAYSTSQGGVSSLILGGAAGAAGLIGGGLGGGFGQASGAVSTTQRTLTIIIKYDGNGKVRDFAYRTSSF